MCTFSTSSEKVKVIGYFDLTSAILTVVVVGYVVILPYSPYNSTSYLLSWPRNTMTPETPDILKPLEPFPFWLSVGVFGTLSLIGILWSWVLVKTSKLEAHRVREKYKMLGYWLICNGLLDIILTYLWFFVVSVGVSPHPTFYKKPAVQIAFGSCYIFRILLIFLVWRERRNFSAEREMTDEDIERWRTNVGYDREEQKAALGPLRGRFYSKTLAKDMFHGNQLELKPYRGEGLMANCECVATQANL